MSQPLVSIIIPTFNRAHLIEGTLESIMAQTYQNWECIIVDDGSTDVTLEVLAIYARLDTRIVFYKRPNGLPKGVNVCRAYGFEKSKGEYISWFDSDDIMHPDKLFKTLGLFKDNALDCIVHNFKYFRPNQYTGEPFNDFGTVSDIKNDYFSGQLILNFQSLLWKREAVDMDWMRPDLSYAEDVFFIGNHFLKANFKVKVWDEVLVDIQKHERFINI